MIEVTNNLDLLYVALAAIFVGLALFFHATYRYDREKQLDMKTRKG